MPSIPMDEFEEICKEDDVEELTALLDSGLSVDARPHDREGWTLLMIAVHAGSNRCVDLLLERGADPNLAGSDLSCYPLTFADAKTSRKLVRMGARVASDPNRNATSWSKVVHYSAETGNLEKLRVLLDEADGALQLEAYDYTFGMTPLGLAAMNGHAEVVKFLLGHFADPDNCDQDHIAYFPLECAASAEHLECFSALLEAGADPDAAWGLCGTGRSTALSKGGGFAALICEYDATLRSKALNAKVARAWYFHRSHAELPWGHCRHLRACIRQHLLEVPCRLQTEQKWAWVLASVPDWSLVLEDGGKRRFGLLGRAPVEWFPRLVDAATRWESVSVL